MLAFDEYAEANWPSNSFPRNSILALASGRFVVMNGTQFLLDVSDIMSLTTNLPTLSYVKLTNSTGLAFPSQYTQQVECISFDDAFIGGGKNMQFYLMGIVTQTKTDTSPVRGSYTETRTTSMSSGIGGGYSQNTPCICTGWFSATASSSLTLTR